MTATVMTYLERVKKQEDKIWDWKQDLYEIFEKGICMYKKHSTIERVLHNIQNTKAYFSIIIQQLNLI